MAAMMVRRGTCDVREASVVVIHCAFGMGED
jgi:hypothetical protein